MKFRTVEMRFCSEATAILVPVTKRGVFKRGILKNLVSHVLNLKSWSNSFVTKEEYVILSQISLIQLFNFKTGQTDFVLTIETPVSKFGITHF